MNFKIKLLSLLTLGITTALAFGSSFQNFEQSATLMGQANAGTSVTTDPSIQYYNPAGMAFINDTEIGISGIFLRTNAEITPVQATGADGRNILPGSSLTPPEFQTLIPAIYMIHPIDPKLRFGIGLEAPFGLETLYPKDSVARYFALESKLTTINLNPSFSYLIRPDFSIGAGLIMQYAEANLSQAIDGAGVVNAINFANSSSPVLSPRDIFIDNNASGTALGWDIGVEVKPNVNNAIGLSYHSQVTQNLVGSAAVTGNQFAQQQLQNAGIILSQSGLSTTLNLPGYITLSGSHKITQKWAVMADAEYTLWDRLKSLTINYTVPGMLSATLPFDYRNTWRIALGQSYQIEQDLRLRMGIAWDQTPVPNSMVRSARLPDNNRFWISTGGTYDFSKNADISFGYSHIFIKDNTVNSHNSLLPAETLIANYSGSVDVLGVQLNIKFV